MVYGLVGAIQLFQRPDMCRCGVDNDSLLPPRNDGRSSPGGGRSRTENSVAVPLKNYGLLPIMIPRERIGVPTRKLPYRTVDFTEPFYFYKF